MRLTDENRDIMSMLPYLSTYMKHTCYRHTLYYVHLLPERLRMSNNIVWEKFEGMYPEVSYEED